MGGRPPQTEIVARAKTFGIAERSISCLQDHGSWVASQHAHRGRAGSDSRGDERTYSRVFEQDSWNSQSYFWAALHTSMPQTN